MSPSYQSKNYDLIFNKLCNIEKRIKKYKKIKIPQIKRVAIPRNTYKGYKVWEKEALMIREYLNAFLVMYCNISKKMESLEKYYVNVAGDISELTNQIKLDLL